MDLASLSIRAQEIRALYSTLDTARGGRPWTREALAQGFVGDVGDLMKLVMAKAGARVEKNIDEKLAHELADCLWSVLVLADAYGVDLEQAFTANMDGVEAKLRAEQV
jgi:NTP pyrophosphatase (non-canonical NTP hydrolase)